MDANQATIKMIRALNDVGVPYMLVGSLSSNYYGVARSTRDADFAVDVQDDQDALPALAQKLLPEIQRDPQIQLETVGGTAKHLFRIVGEKFEIELFEIGRDPHDQERFRRRQRVHLLGEEVSIPTVEDVIIAKLRWGRSKDIGDILAVVKLNAEMVDWPYVESWCDRHGTRELLEQIRQDA